MNTLPYKFGGFDFSYEESKVVILPVPYDSTTSYIPGTRFGPSKIIDASRFLEFYDIEEDFEPYTVGIYTMDEIETSKRGPEFVINDIKDIIAKLIEDNKFPITLGGDHSISLGPILAFHDRNRAFSVVQFDAHTDLREEYEGTKFGHASVARRVAEYVDILQIGIRSASKEGAEFIKSTDKVSIIKAKEFSISSLEKHLLGLKDDIYITLDVDVFDPSVIPSVGTPEPGGLNFSQVSDAIKLISQKKNIIGMDVVELSPIPYLVYPEFTISKLIYRIIGFIFKKRKD